MSEKQQHKATENKTDISAVISLDLWDTAASAGWHTLMPRFLWSFSQLCRSQEPGAEWHSVHRHLKRCTYITLSFLYSFLCPFMDVFNGRCAFFCVVFMTAASLPVFCATSFFLFSASLSPTTWACRTVAVGCRACSYLFLLWGPVRI